MLLICVNLVINYEKNNELILMHTAPPRPVRHLKLHAVADKHDEEQRLDVM